MYSTPLDVMTVSQIRSNTAHFIVRGKQIIFIILTREDAIFCFFYSTPWIYSFIVALGVEPKALCMKNKLYH